MLRRIVAAACVVLALTSCSSVKPKRVTSSNETTAVGLRYYETRPFLVVRKPYPISSEPFLVQGVLANDGKTFFVQDAPAELKLPKWTALNIAQPLAPAAQGGGRAAAPAAQGETPADTGEQTPGAEQEGSKKEADTACQKGTETTTKKADGEASETKNIECKDTSGQRLAFSSISLETDLTATALVPINELFSIIYLPDYDREFYIEANARWGLSKLHVTRGPGGVLLAYNSEVDNSAVVKPLFDAWNMLVSAATKAAVIKIEPKAQGERVDVTKTAPLTPQGVPATLRIHRVKFAVPGAYPFIKPQEVGAWRAATPEQSARMLVPSFPYQIPYDYFTVLVAEHLLDPPGASALVSEVSGAVSSRGGTSDTEGGQAAQKGALNCPRDHKRPPASFNATSANVILQSDPELKDSVTQVQVTRQDPIGCAATVQVQFTGDASKKDAIEAKLKKSFAGAQFNVSQ